jgi:hypothetical protein
MRVESRGKSLIFALSFIMSCQILNHCLDFWAFVIIIITIVQATPKLEWFKYV